MKTEVRRIIAQITSAQGGFTVPPEFVPELKSGKVIKGLPISFRHFAPPGTHITVGTLDDYDSSMEQGEGT